MKQSPVSPCGFSNGQEKYQKLKDDIGDKVETIKAGYLLIKGRVYLCPLETMELSQKEKNKPDNHSPSVTIREIKIFVFSIGKLNWKKGGRKWREEVKKRGIWFTRIFQLPQDAVEGPVKLAAKELQKTGIQKEQIFLETTQIIRKKTKV